MEKTTTRNFNSNPAKWIGYTWTELKALLDAGTLEAGSHYLCIDFADTLGVGYVHTPPVNNSILFAADYNSFSKTALDVTTGEPYNYDLATNNIVEAGATLGLFELQAGIDASANPNYPKADKGDVSKITVAGKIGGAAGIDVQVGDLILALADTAAGDHATVGANWNVIQTNIMLASLAEAIAGVNAVNMMTPERTANAIQSAKFLLFGVATNIGNAYTAALAPVAEPVDGKIYIFEPNATNTGAVTLNTIPVKKWGYNGAMSELEANDLVANTHSILVYSNVKAGYILIGTPNGFTSEGGYFSMEKGTLYCYFDARNAYHTTGIAAADAISGIVDEAIDYSLQKAWAILQKQIGVNEFSWFTNANKIGFFNKGTLAASVAQQAAMTVADTSVIVGGGAAVWTNADKATVDNMRTRINQLETIMKAYGLLPA